ncbi:MAG: hypothetical protein FJY85_23740, partial [Deltaproteobacteria bacterium]|nr:hypothetical protein [Deltaproteobacteria bacterium]
MPLSGVTAIQLDLGDALQSVQKVLSVSDESYRVILEGTVREGFKRGRVVKNLAALFKKDLASVERLLSGKPRPIRTGVKRETASRYVKIIQEAGAVAWVELEAPPKAEPEVTEQPVVVPEKEPIVPDVICPRCGYQASREDDVMLVRGDCPKCGLLVR